MKNLSLVICLLISPFSACSQQNNFKLKGEIPDGSFNTIELRDGDIVDEDVNSKPLRNRVYIVIDSLNQLTLNGHLLSTSEVEERLDYVCNNPEQLEHLPIHPDSVVICIKSDATDFQILPKNLSKRFKIAVLVPSPDDRGISVKLPPWSEEEPDITKLKARNVLKITVDAQNKIYVNGKETKVEELTARAKAFIANPEGHPDLAESPRKAIVSLKNERGTNYKEYLAAYNALKAAYYELWDELSQRKYGVPYSDDMPFNQKRAIREEIPFVLSEAEPTSFGSSFSTLQRSSSYF